MKTLYFNNKKYQAKKIIKTNTSIIGYIGETEAFSFLGINDFSLFQLEQGQNFDIEEKELLQQRLQSTEYALLFIMDMMGGM